MPVINVALVFDVVARRTLLLDEAIFSHVGDCFSGRAPLRNDKYNTVVTIDRLEDFEYISGVNKRLGIRYNYPPPINLTP
jgi:hypothetical protein